MRYDDRAHDEPHATLLRPFELDRHRILASTAFRRLEGKTQVFAPSYHDHFRTRLTHTLEVAHIARCLARLLGCDEGLTEAIVLAHDLGHAPFGHAGEAALNQRMKNHGGFNHNAHSLRVVDYLEHPIPDFRGLNLTRGTRDGLRSHVTRYDAPEYPVAGPGEIDGTLAPLLDKEGSGEVPGRPQDPPQSPLGKGGGKSADRSGGDPSAEAQIASTADRIAYDCHDLEDAIGAEIVLIDDLSEVALWREACASTGVALDHGNIHAVRRVVLDALQHGLLADAAQTSKPLLSTDRRIQLSGSVAKQLDALEDFLGAHVYQHPTIAATDAAGRDMIDALFDRLAKHVDLMPQRFRDRINEQGVECVVCDYIAGMTDRFGRDAYDRFVVGG